MEPRTCGHCGKSLEPNQKKFCSPECLADEMRAPGIKCEVCGKHFKPIRKSQKNCSMDCFNASRISKKKLLEEPEAVFGAKWIPLTQGKWALVDEDDHTDLSEYNWCAVKVRPNSRGELLYAKRTDKPVYMHRQITGAGPKDITDHMNGDGLDNRQSNLLLGDGPVNQANSLVMVGKSSGYKGVHTTQSSKWAVRLMRRNVEKYIGTFDNKEEAARAYDTALRFYRQPNATYNFPKSGERSAITGEVQS